MNLPTILILALIGIALFAALRSMKKHPSDDYFLLGTL